VKFTNLGFGLSVKTSLNKVKTKVLWVKIYLTFTTSLLSDISRTPKAMTSWQWILFCMATSQVDLVTLATQTVKQASKSNMRNNKRQHKTNRNKVCIQLACSQLKTFSMVKNFALITVL